MKMVTKKHIQEAIKKEPWTLAIIGLIMVAFIAALLSSSKQHQDSPKNIETTIKEKKSDDIEKAKTCILDECLEVQSLTYPISSVPSSVEDILKQALEGEYKAQATYRASIENFGSKRPFIMIIRAQEQHISVLQSLFDKYSLEIPENLWLQKKVSVASIQEACRSGMKSELANIDLYKNELIPLVKEYEDITRVFTDLMNASEHRHLPAFEQCSNS